MDKKLWSEWKATDSQDYHEWLEERVNSLESKMENLSETNKVLHGKGDSVMDLTQINMTLRHTYETEPWCSNSIDSLCSSTEPIKQLTDLYLPFYVRKIIQEFWLIGRVVFDYFVDSSEERNIYDPNHIDIKMVPKIRYPVILVGETDITKNVLFLKRATSEYDHMGTSILMDSKALLDNKPSEIFNAAFSNAISQRESDGSFIK